MSINKKPRYLAGLDDLLIKEFISTAPSFWFAYLSPANLSIA